MAERWSKPFLFLVGSLSSTILLKVNQVQYLEIIYFVFLLVLIAALPRYNYRIRCPRICIEVSSLYCIFFLAAMALSLAALRYDFYFPDQISILRYPVIIALSRIIELALSVFFMVYFVTVTKAESSLLRFTMRTYFWAGVASAVYSILSLPFDLTGLVSLGAYGNLHRMRGFYNEGGPYGLYVLSLIFVGFALYKLRWDKQQRLQIAAIPLLVAFLGSQSKAAFMAVIVIVILNGAMARQLTHRLLLLGALTTVVVVASQVVDLGSALRLYQKESEAYESASRLRALDGSFVYGRVAATFIMPRIFVRHPWGGIGWGNYELVRNAPEYRGASVFVRYVDDPGMGILGTAVELGLPLFAYLVFCLLIPFIYTRKKKMPLYITNMALLQPVVHFMGAQLNLTYPWLTSAFALSLAYAYAHNRWDAPSHSSGNDALLIGEHS